MPYWPRRNCLPERPSVPSDLVRMVERDYERFAAQGLPRDLEGYLADHYQLDVAAEYAGCPLKNPWGKASGQLSMTARQVAEDVEAGLGFVVLKTVIAQDDAGRQTMEAWAIKESRMVAEPIVGKSGERGWTISWKGRGWWHSFEDYLQFIRDARQAAAGSGTLIAPSCKYHLPNPGEAVWRVEEYRYTTPRLLEAWREADDAPQPMPLEKDFSPTLAGSDLATAQAQILNWLEWVPELIRSAVPGESAAKRSGAAVRVGLKIFNALFDEAFQLEMLRTLHAAGDRRPDFFIYGNRLFDPERVFDGKQGVAYGGPDLSDRNLAVMGAFQDQARRGEIAGPVLPWSATGNITTGKIALEYALRGASSFQLHTFFQLPGGQYRMRTGSKTAKALHELYFHPSTGFIVWMHHLKRQLMPDEPAANFRKIVGRVMDLVPQDNG